MEDKRAFMPTYKFWKAGGKIPFQNIPETKWIPSLPLRCIYQLLRGYAWRTIALGFRKSDDSRPISGVRTALCCGVVVAAVAW